MEDGVHIPSRSHHVHSRGKTGYILHDYDIRVIFIDLCDCFASDNYFFELHKTKMLLIFICTFTDFHKFCTVEFFSRQSF